MSLQKRNARSGSFTLSRIGADICTDADYIDTVSLLWTYDKRALSRVVGYWQSSSRHKGCTFRVELIGSEVYFIPVVGVSPLCSKEALSVPKPGWFILSGSKEWRDYFRTMNYERLSASHSHSIRRVS
jgi:hypothetical protein